ncbi:MAG: NifU family protein [Bacteroidota bacterium]
MVIHTEITPNPATLKFVAQKVLLARGSADFPNPDEAGDSPLAQKMFEFAFVKGVFIGYNFVSISKDEATQWEDVIPPIKDTLRAFLNSGEAILLNQDDEVEAVPEEEEDETVRRIKQLLDENIRPAVAMDGGDVIYESFVDGVVKLRLQGACSGCPSSTMTLKMGIEGLLTRMVPGVTTVEAV